MFCASSMQLVSDLCLWHFLVIVTCLFVFVENHHRESLTQFKNQIKPREYVRSIRHSTMYEQDKFDEFISPDKGLFQRNM